jgi:hypothetical protein
MMARLTAAALAAASLLATARAAEAPLLVHYNERPPHHYTERGVPAGDAVVKVSSALKAANIPYQLRSTPAKQQLVLLQKNETPACMLAWVDLPGRDRSGKFSEVIYADAPRGSERRLWCTKATPDETMQRIDAALRNAALPK